MSFDNLLTLISSYGFPIVMCLVLFFYMQKKDENHKKEIDSLKEAIDNNTQVLSKFIDKGL